MVPGAIFIETHKYDFLSLCHFEKERKTDKERGREKERKNWAVSCFVTALCSADKVMQCNLIRISCRFSVGGSGVRS